MSRDLLKHHQRCVDASCEVCTPVKNYVARQRQAQELEKRQREEQLQQQQLQYQRQQHQQQQQQHQQYEHAQHHHIPNQVRCMAGQRGLVAHTLTDCHFVLRKAGINLVFCPQCVLSATVQSSPCMWQQGQNGVPKHVLGKRGIGELENGHVQPQQAQQQPQQYAVKRFRTVVDPVSSVGCWQPSPPENLQHGIRFHCAAHPVHLPLCQHIV